MEKPSNFTKTKVPISETGVAMSESWSFASHLKDEDHQITRGSQTYREDYVADRFAHASVVSKARR